MSTVLFIFCKTENHSIKNKRKLGDSNVSKNAGRLVETYRFFHAGFSEPADGVSVVMVYQGGEFFFPEKTGKWDCMDRTGAVFGMCIVSDRKS